MQQNQDNMICNERNRKMRSLEIVEEVFICNFGIGSRWLSEVIANENGPMSWIVKIRHNENVIRHAAHIWKRTLDKLTDNEPVIEFSSMQSMNGEVKHSSYVTNKIVPVRTPIMIRILLIIIMIIKLYQTKMILCATQTLIHRISTRHVFYVDQQELGSNLPVWTMCNPKLVIK